MKIVHSEMGIVHPIRNFVEMFNKVKYLSDLDFLLAKTHYVAYCFDNFFPQSIAEVAIKGTRTVRECVLHAHCADRTPQSKKSAPAQLIAQSS